MSVEVTATTIQIRLQPNVAPVYERPDCQEPVAAAYYDSELLTVQGLGVSGKAVRYQVKSIRLKKRDARHIQVILRWLRILGLSIQVVYVDFWSAYPAAIQAIYPPATIQYDFFMLCKTFTVISTKR